MPARNKPLNNYLFTTWNVRGLGTPQKRYKTLAQLRRRGTQIAFIQETHLLREESDKLRKKWNGQLYSTNYLSFARGVAIWIKPGVPFAVEEERIDPHSVMSYYKAD